MPLRTRQALALVAFLILTIASAAAQSPPRSSIQPTTQAQVSGNQDDLSAMKADLAKMRVLVTQMQNNLGLTTNTTTPLYHQFELEIDMWQLLINHLERQIEHLEREKGSSRKE